MSIRVLLSVEFCFTLKTYIKGAPFYNASKPDEAPPPLRCAVQGFAPLRRRCGVTAMANRVRRNRRRT
jgi:hypothetical protein